MGLLANFHTENINGLPRFADSFLYFSKQSRKCYGTQVRSLFERSQKGAQLSADGLALVIYIQVAES